jgi:hypothetical protein
MVDFMSRDHALTAIAVAAITLGLGTPARAQEPSDIQKQLDELKRGQEQIRKDLDEIKRLLQARPPMAQPTVTAPQPNVRNMPFDISGNPVKGLSSAQLTLIEFTDYQ